MTLTISRSFTLQAAHSLPATPEDHKCHRMHGHTWQCTIFVQGELDPQLMWIVDYADIDAIWHRRVFSILDHSTLNDTIPNPTTEAMAFWFYQAMAEDFSKLGARLVRIELAEGPNNRCDLDIDAADPPVRSLEEQFSLSKGNALAICDPANAWRNALARDRAKYNALVDVHRELLGRLGYEPLDVASDQVETLRERVTYLLRNFARQFRGDETDVALLAAGLDILMKR